MTTSTSATTVEVPENIQGHNSSQLEVSEKADGQSDLARLRCPEEISPRDIHGIRWVLVGEEVPMIKRGNILS
jgi:hypothetical protein